MGARFSKDQPWHFGYTPSDYYETLSKEQKNRVCLKAISLADLDELYALTLTTPPSWEPALDEFIYWQQVAAYPLRIPAAVAAHCKPLGEIEGSEYTADVVEPVFERLGLPHSWLGNEFFVAASDDILEACVDYTRSPHRVMLSRSDKDVVEGILYGYPVGDVFAFSYEREARYNAYKDKNYWTEALQKKHDLYPSIMHVEGHYGWSEEWMKEVGVLGLVHLAQTISQATTGQPDPRKSIYAHSSMDDALVCQRDTDQHWDQHLEWVEMLRPNAP